LELKIGENKMSKIRYGRGVEKKLKENDAKIRNSGTVEAISIEAFCTEFGVGKTFAYGEIARGKLIARKAGRRTLIARDDAHRWLKSLPICEDKTVGAVSA
jgi:hypothetical protein